jgi:hypothetical protein
MTTSELIVTLTIWLLTAIGGFFGLRAAWRRRQRQPGRPPDATHHHRRRKKGPGLN